MKKSTFLLLMAFSLLSGYNAWSQNWSVNPADFQYTMTITGVGLFQCEETTKSTDMVVAFINGECRGVQSFDTDYEGRQYAFLTVYDTVPQGSTIEFQLFDSESGTSYDHVYTLVFEENSIAGSLTTPYEFKTNYETTGLRLSNNIVYDFNVSGDLVGQVFSINEVGDSLDYILDFVDDSLGIDNSYFALSNNEIYLSEDVDFENKKSYQIHLLSISPVGGCLQNEVFEIEVVNTNIAPTGLSRADTTINENEPIGSLVCQLIALDESVIDQHRFELVGSLTDFPDNEFFTINDQELLSNAEFDYEEKFEYRLQIQIKDRVGNIYIDTFRISILDVIEFDDLKAGNLITPNDDGFNDHFTIPNVELFINYELCIYNDNGNLVFRQNGNYQNDWDGKSDREKELPNGTYYFILRDRTDFGNAFKGEIHLYRPNQF
ncbi:MAG: hypothetical protein Sapg2KO_01160 [Saprospiraceae bacterium]